MLYRAASSVDSITDYNEFAPLALFKATFLFNCIISLIFILVVCRLSVH